MMEICMINLTRRCMKKSTGTVRIHVELSKLIFVFYDVIIYLKSFFGGRADESKKFGISTYFNYFCDFF